MSHASAATQEAMPVACPLCGVQPGQLCRIAKTGGVAAFPHTARLSLARGKPPEYVADSVRASQGGVARGGEQR